MQKICGLNFEIIKKLNSIIKLLSQYETKGDYAGLIDELKDLSKVYAGQIIEYKVHPILGIPLYWMTEITQVEHHKYFVDNQVFGPYSLWHHQHHFKEVEGGVEMTDIVHYKLPFWFLGDIANSLFVKAQLKEIFDYRFKKVEEIF